MENKQEVSFPDEALYLEKINDRLNEALKEAHESVIKLDKDYKSAKRYMADYRGEIDPHEMFQNELALKQIDHIGAFAAGVWERLLKLKDSPYFARIDFQARDRKAAKKYYIGRFTFHYENELLIFDWRSPVAGMFYDCEVGPAGYDAPVGRIKGELIRKRQFKVQGGELKYVLESSLNIQDDVLQRELSHTSDDKMKSIISTIQKEQNQIIRNENAKTLIIQGAAGSGKTSIALHRIAFLLYRFKDKLTAENIAILSPNKVFGDYISAVLPELGEEPIYELGFEDIAATQLAGVIDFEPDKDPLEHEDAKWAERVRFKSTLSFVKQMEEFVKELPDIVFAPKAYSFGGFTADEELVGSRFRAFHAHPIKKRLQLMAEELHSRFEADNFMGDEVPARGKIIKSLLQMLKIKNSPALYKEFYNWLKRPDMLVFSAKKTLEWADVYPFLYLHGVFEGFREDMLLKHLVIDEMQDYTPVQFAVINRLFSCQKTILGDFGQLINPNHLSTLEDMRQQFYDGSLVELTKSYRSTYEIITFAKKIKPAERLSPVERHGESPLVIRCTNEKEKIEAVKDRLNTFKTSGYASLGIILKTNQAAKNFYEKLSELSEDYQVHLISTESTRFTNGISVTSIQMSKGLEFDEAVILDVDCDTYYTEYDRCLLYIAVTRAMHRLTVLYTGKPSEFLPMG